MNRLKLLTAGIGALVIVVAIWSFFVVKFESPLGTDNVVHIERSTVLTNDTSDTLASLTFAEGAEDLEWSSIEIIVKNGNQQFPCSFGSMSLGQTTPSKVAPTLSADGVTFTTEVDATDEETYTQFNLPTQQESDSNDSTMEFSKTDVFLSNGVEWVFLENQEFSEVTTAEGLTFSNDTNERLDWYTYDMLAHRVEPNEGVYVLKLGEDTYKIQFLSYYNDEDEGRHPTMLISALDQTVFPALLDETLVAPSPCIILSEDPQSFVWNASERIELAEHNTNICSQECDMELFIFYQTMRVETQVV
jgi:hypothetical protein